MNPYIWRVTCSVCGGGAVGTPDCMVASWRGSFVYHRDPQVCAAVLAERARVVRAHLAKVAQAVAP